MANTIELIREALQDDRNRMAVKNLIIDWQKSKGELEVLKTMLEKEFGQKQAALFLSTDVRTLQILVQQINIQKRGNVKIVKWFTSNDDQVCDVCRERDGEEFSVDAIHEIMPAHDGCRCEFKPVFNLSISEQKLREIMEKK